MEWDGLKKKQQQKTSKGITVLNVKCEITKIQKKLKKTMETMESSVVARG